MRTLTQAMCLVVVVGGVVASVGCGARQRAAALGPGEAHVAEVKIVGNERASTRALRDGLALTRQRADGQEFDPYLVGQDLERLRGYYLRRGFFRVNVTATVEQTDDAATVTFTIVEGPRARLARVEMHGLPEDELVVEKDLRALIPLDDGDAFVYEDYDRARPLIVAALEAAGYAHARLDAKVAADRVLDEAVVVLDVTPGPLCHFGAIEARGAEGALAGVVRARLSARPGERYSTTVLREMQADIYDTGRFATVRVESDRSAGGAEVPIIITVVEQTPHELRLGGGVGLNPTELQIRGRAMYSIAGFPTDLTTTRLELRPAYVFPRDGTPAEPRIEAIAALDRLDFLRPRLRAEAELSFSYLSIEAYTSYGPRVRLGLRSPLYRRYLAAAAGWQLRVLDFTKLSDAIDPSTAAELGISAPYWLGFYEQALFLDLRDDLVAPRLGLYGEIRLEEGTRAAGGDFDYVRVTPEVRTYLPLERFVLATRFRLGTIAGGLPVTQRYLAGGASSQRGFPERRLAQTVTRVKEDGSSVSVVIGGGALLEASAELRTRLGKLIGIDWSGVLFLDGGDVTERLDGLDVTHLHWAAGAGLRAATPVGPVRVDVGYRLNRLDDLRPGERVAYHLSLGEAF